jgi:F0F1-type ATP synthase epsilon subunit
MVIHNGRRRDVFLVSGGFVRVSLERFSMLAFSLERATDSTALKKCRALRRELRD